MSLAESFSEFPVATWAEGSDHGSWHVDFDGGGIIQIVDASADSGTSTVGASLLGGLILGAGALAASPGTTSPGTTRYLRCEPQVSTSSGETHAPLVTSPSMYQPGYIHAEFVTRAQLRTGSAPNAWEVAWLLFNYTSTDSFYYVTLKPNGWELGKEYNLGAGQQQQFLATGSSPTYAVGNSLQLDIELSYGTGVTVITVKAKDGAGAWQTLTTYTDDGSTVSGAALQYGKIGLYNEDARVDWGAVAASMTEPGSFTATLEVEFTAGTWTDITSYICYSAPVRIRQGRATEYDTVTAGVMSLTLWNDDGRFMPGNGNGAYWPNWGKHKRIRWKVTKDGTTYTRFVGWIQAIAPTFPTDSTNGATVAVTATDALGLLTQRKLRSNFTETVIWRGRLDSVQCDAYEANGKVTGLLALWTQYSEDSGALKGTAAYAGGTPTMTFGTDNDVSIGGVATAPQATFVNRSMLQFQATPLKVVWHVKLPASQVPTLPTTPAVTIWKIGTLHDSTTGASPIGHLALTPTSGSLDNNDMIIRNAADTSSVANFGSVLLGQWVRMEVVSDSGTPSTSTWRAYRADNSYIGYASVAIDIRNCRALEIPTSTNYNAGASFGGVAALGSRTGMDVAESFVGMAGRSLATRVGHLANAVGLLPVTISTLGTLTGDVCTGVWSDRSAADVLVEMLATYSGLAWARSRDSVIYAIGSDQLYPNNVVVTIDTDADCLGAPSLVDGAEMQASRIDVQWPGGTTTVTDGTLETDGVIRSKSISTVAPDATTAAAAGQAILDRGVDGTRISRIVVDLLAASADPTAALFDEGTTLGGLFPTQRIRLWVPESHFGVPTTDVHVQGWEESYSPDGCSLTLDTTPAISTLLAYEEWTGSNGSAWNGSIWSSTGGSGASGSTVDIQSNRGRILAGAGGDVWKRLTAGTAADVEITGLFTLGSSTAEAQVVWRSDTTLANCYYLGAKVSGGLFINKVVSGSISTVVNGFGPTIAASTDYRYRIRHQGSWLTVRVWAASGTEPGPWDAIGQESTFLDAGYIALRQWTASQAATFDDLDLYTGA